MSRSTFISSIVVCLALLLAGAARAQTTTGLVAAYGFDEGTGTAIRDISGLNNNGTASGTAWAAGKFGNALVFNGTNAQVTVPNAASLQLTSGMTLEAWVFPTTAPTGWRSIVDKNVDGYYLMASTDNGNRPGVGGTWTDGNKNVFGPSALPVNTWTHLAATFDGTTTRLFVNGVQVASQTQSAALQTTTATLQIGADAYTTEYFAGLIDEVRIYNRALSAAEIQADMAAPVSSVTPPPPVGDTTAPSAPGTLTATASGSTQINLAWGAATDNVGVTGYSVERCQGSGCTTFTQVFTLTGTTFSNTGLTAGTSYSYRVRATDAAGNLGSYSNVASATTTTTDTTPPSAPPTLSATAASATQIDLVWTAATDNVGVTGYRVERCQGSGCATFTQIFTLSGTTFSNLGLTASTSYSYRVRAVDAAGNLGPYSVIASATTPAVPDTTPPSVPAGLAAVAASPTQISVSWTAATDNVGVIGYQLERCSGAGCGTFAQIAAPTGTSFNDSSLTAATSYSYRVRAVDAAGNLGGYSLVASATTPAPDTTAPTTPTGLTATVISASQINLSWTASTDNVAVTGYELQRCQGIGCTTFIQIATPTGASYSDTGLTGSTTYRYWVRATDAAGNLSPWSSIITVTTPTPDTSGLVAAYGFDEGTGTAIRDASGQNNNGIASGTTWATGKFGNALVFNGTNAQVTVPNAASLQLTTAMTLEAWVFPTTAPTGWRSIVDKNVDGYYLMASTDNGNLPGVGGNWTNGNRNVFGTSVIPVNAWTHLATTFDGSTIRLFVNGVQVASVAQTTPLAPTTATLQIGADAYVGENFAGLIDEVRVYNRALSAAEIQVDMATSVASVTPPPPVGDTTAPSAPGTLTATVSGSTQINLAWGAATDNVGVTGYRVERCAGAGCSTFVQIAAPTATSFSDTGLTAGTSYSYQVRATDAAGNLGGYSNVASAATPSPVGDTTPPSVPAGLAAVATSQTQISVSWTAATDNVGVIGYQLERCSGSGCSTFAQIAAPTGTSFNDSSLTAATSYSYRVRAVDAAGNLGGYSLVASATTPAPDTTAPTTPTGLTATAVSASQVNLSWIASTDNVAVTGYILQRCLGAGCTAWVTIANPTATTYSDTGLSATTTYRYWVRATDAAGNLSPWSSIVTVTTLTPDTSGLVAAYGFDEGTGTAIRDASGQNNNGVAGGTTWTTGKFGNALVFDGASAQVTIQDAPSLRLTTAMTLEAWVFPTTAPAGWKAIIDKNVDGYYLMASTDNGNRPGVGGTWTDGNKNVFGPSALPVNAWTHLATTFDGTAVRLYVNGVQVASQAQTAPLAPAIATLQIGGDAYVGENFAGLIDEVRIYNRALSPAEIQVDMLTAVAAAAPPPQSDTTPPSVSITSPANGATVVNTVSVSANATDDVGVASVQFLLDSSPLGTPVTSAPFSVAWDTATTVAGSHVLQARATDFAGNGTTSAAVTVSVGTPTGATAGQWAAPVAWPIVAVHANLLATGEILAWDGQDFGNQARVWSPATGTFTSVPNSLTNIFCAGHCLLPDGRALVAGGHNGAHIGLPDTNIFDPATRTWSRVAPMAVGRWYPTVTGLPDGRMLVTAGEIDCGGCIATIPEIFDPQLASWTQLTGASQSFPYYPHMFVMGDGRVLAAATTEAPIVSRVLDIPTQTWSVVDPTAVDGGSSVMYAPGKIMKSGRSVDPDQPVIPSTATTYVLDMNQPTPRWRQTAPMNFARTFHTLTLLPDGTVLATGGGPTTDALGVDNAVLAAELWSPVTETWTTLASMQRPRLYHSNALLLPDGRVLVLGGGRFNGGDAPTDQKSSEIFSPPYLFNGARPVISSAPSTAAYGTGITVQTPDAASIGSVVLMKLGTVTHSFNTNQRIVQLAFTAGAGALSVQTPANANLAPPGHYMLFILNTSGVPSVASIVQLQ